MAEQKKKPPSPSLEAPLPFREQGEATSTGAGLGDSGAGGGGFESQSTGFDGKYSFGLNNLFGSKSTGTSESKIGGFGSQSTGFGGKYSFGLNNLFGSQSTEFGSTSGSKTGGFGSQSTGFGGNTLFGVSNLFEGKKLFSDSTSRFGARGSQAGNAADMTNIIGRRVSGYSMTLDGTSLRIDLAHPGSFGRPLGDELFVKYRTDSGGPFCDRGLTFGTPQKGLSGLQYFPLASIQDGAIGSQVPLTEDFQAHTEQFFAETCHYQAITSSNPFGNLSFEELRLIDHHRGRYPNGIPGPGFGFDPKLRTNLPHPSLSERPPSSENSFERYLAYSGPFGLPSTTPYPPPAAQDGTPAQISLTERFQEYIGIEPGSTQPCHYQSVPFSAPFRNFSFEELRLVDYQQRLQNAFPNLGFTTSSNTSNSPFLKFPTLASTGDKNPLLTSSTAAFRSSPTGAGSLFRPPFGQRELPPITSDPFGFGKLRSFTSSAKEAARSQGTFKSFLAYAEQEPFHIYHYQSLGFLDPFKTSSFEELRLADYNQGRRYEAASDNLVGSFRASQGNPTTLFGKTVFAGEPGNQSVDIASPFNGNQISRAIAQISTNNSSTPLQPWKFPGTTPSGGKSPDTAIPSNGGPEAASFSSERTSEASDKTKLPDNCTQQ